MDHPHTFDQWMAEHINSDEVDDNAVADTMISVWVSLHELQEF